MVAIFWAEIGLDYEVWVPTTGLQCVVVNVFTVVNVFGIFSPAYLLQMLQRASNCFNFDLSSFLYSKHEGKTFRYIMNNFSPFIG
jgi:hypothetical protein